MYTSINQVKIYNAANELQVRNISFKKRLSSNQKQFRSNMGEGCKGKTGNVNFWQFEKTHI